LSGEQSAQLYILLSVFVSGMWTSKSSYAEAELNEIYELNHLLSLISYRGFVTTDVIEQADAIAGD